MVRLQGMKTSSPDPQSDTKKLLRTQQLTLLGLAAVALIIGWLDGLNGFTHAVQYTHAKQEVVMITSRWYMTFSLPLVSLVAIVMAGIAYRRQQVFALKTMVVSGTVTVSAVIALGVCALIGFDSWIGKQGYEHCTTLDRTQGVTRHGTRHVEVSAWTIKGQCR